MRGVHVFIAIAIAGCGGDDEGGKPPPPPRATAAAAPAGGGTAGAPGAAGKGLTPMTHVEERVTCPVPQKATDKLPTVDDKCDPKAPVPCGTKAKPYCLNVPIMSGNYCFACPDREAIRHPFKDRDFAPDPNQNRDPFQSFILVAQGAGSNADKPVIDAATQPACTDKNSFAGSYSYQDLKLVGLVTQGTQRKALMAAGRASYILKRNDCAGKEKALVKEVGDGYITFVTQADPNVKESKPLEYSQQLHTELALNTIESPPDTGTPPPAATVAPPTTSKTDKTEKTDKTDKTDKPAKPTKPAKRLVPIPGPSTKSTIPPPSHAPTQLTP